MNKKELMGLIDTAPGRSAWQRVIKAYACMILEDLEDQDFLLLYYSGELRSVLLNGAEDWRQYSWGGCALIYDADVAEMLCSPSELKKTKNGERRPNRSEQWLDVQARALIQAYGLIRKILGGVLRCY